jgi:hypothetical protein
MSENLVMGVNLQRRLEVDLTLIRQKIVEMYPSAAVTISMSAKEPNTLKVLFS